MGPINNNCCFCFGWRTGRRSSEKLLKVWSWWGKSSKR